MDFPIENGGSFHSYVKLPEGSDQNQGVWLDVITLDHREYHFEKHFQASKTDDTYLVGGDWNHGILNDFPYIANVIIPTDEVIFFRGVSQPPTSYHHSPSNFLSPLVNGTCRKVDAWSVEKWN